MSPFTPAGKALGGFGAFIGSSKLIKNYLIQSCRSFIYTTAPPPLMAVHWKAALEVLEREPPPPFDFKKKKPWISEPLFPVSSHWKKRKAPLCPLLVKGAGETLKKAEWLRKQGTEYQSRPLSHCSQGGGKIEDYFKVRSFTRANGDFKIIDSLMWFLY